MKTIHILDTARLPDEGQFVNRFRVSSESSSSLYVISQHREGRWFGCSCPGWTRRPVRNCKHLQALGLPGGQTPLDVRVVAGGAMRAGERMADPEPTYSEKATSLGRRKLDL